VIEAMESRQHLTGTISYVDVPITSAAIAADPTLASLRTLDVRLTVSSGDDWLASDIRVQLTQGSFYNPRAGGNVPDTTEWSDNPHLRFDTWVGGPNTSAPLVLGRQEGSGSAIFSPSEVNVAFGDLQNTGAGTFTIARLTMTQNAVGTINGRFFVLSASSTAVPFTRAITSAVTQPPAITTTIKGWVFNDTNGDSRHDTNEARASGWQVYIDANNNGRLDSNESSVRTNAQGNFTFGQLAAGTYRVRVSLQTGFQRTFPTNSSFSHNVTLTNGLIADRKTFGVTQRAKISGLVYNDSNNNQTKGAGETGLSGWRIYIDRNNNGKFDSNETNVRSASDGSWSFIGLTPGTYNIRIVQVTGFTRTTPSSGVFSVAVGSGAHSTTSNFGQRAI